VASTVGQLLAAQLVDGDVAPGRVVGRPAGQVGELVPLPGQVVVVEDGRPSGQVPGEGGRGAGVSGQRADVLDHHQVGPVKGLGQPAG